VNPFKLLPDRLTNGDRWVLMLAIGLLVSLYSWTWSRDAYGHQANILVEGKQWSRVDLYQAQHIKVPGPLGESELEIRNGKIRFISSPCTLKQCIHYGWLTNGGEFNACLPNLVSVQILSPDPRFDTINF
jgi:hypothetical protein